MVQDASLAEFQGLKNVFPQVNVLMCYFHVTSNVIKNYCKYNVPVSERTKINKEIYFLHESRTYNEYSLRVNMFMYEWTNRGLIEFRDYFWTQWLTPPFDAWQLWRRPPGFATISINESFNKTFKQTFTKYIQSTVMDMFKTTLPICCKYYSLNPKPFQVYPSQIDHKRKVVIKSNKLKIEHFFRLDFNNIRYDGKNKSTGMPYNHFIRLSGPLYCCCSTFLDLAYCHHILAIMRLELATIVLDPIYIKPPQPRRLAVRNIKRGRPKNYQGQALLRE